MILNWLKQRKLKKEILEKQRERILRKARRKYKKGEYTINLLLYKNYRYALHKSMDRNMVARNILNRKPFKVRLHNNTEMFVLDFNHNLALSEKTVNRNLPASGYTGINGLDPKKHVEDYQ